MAQTILLVDDDQDFLEMLDVVLSIKGYRVISCTDAACAHEQAKRFCPDAIIVDLLMPGETGWFVIEQLKDDPQTAGIRVIVCTAAVVEATRQSALLKQWGCDVLFKPFELDDLLRMLANSATQHLAS